jgi:hypothetical protein
MIEHLTGTDIRMLAKGYWERCFEWRPHPKTVMPLGVGIILLGVLALLIFTTAPGSGPNPPLGTAIIVLVLLVAAALLYGFYIYAGEKTAYLNKVVTAWETSETKTRDLLPSEQSVRDFVSGKGD